MGCPATAMVGANDQAAIGFVRGLRAHGVAVPADVSVVGFDDISPCKYVEPPLTTVHVPLYELGVRGLRLALDLLAGLERPRPESLPLELTVRSSTQSPKASSAHGRDRRPSHREMTNDKENEMTLADDLAYRSATDLAQLIRDREVSPVELTDQVIERIEERNPSLNAFVFKGYDDARRAAADAERAVVSGAELGPLHGLPTALKDLFDFKPGWKATFGGLPVLADNVIDAYCVFAERVEKAGAIIVGKTNSPVMGFRGACDNYLFGPTRNPFDTSKNSGGSSGGSAAAVADGLLPFAEGSDGGGSIRIPAAWCGIYGFKPSWGRVPVVLRPDAFAGNQPVRGGRSAHPYRRRRGVGTASPRRLRLARSVQPAGHA